MESRVKSLFTKGTGCVNKLGKQNNMKLGFSDPHNLILSVFGSHPVWRRSEKL